MTYRVEISSVAEAEADSAFLQLSTVRILHIRHAAQQTFGENQESNEV